MDLPAAIEDQKLPGAVDARAVPHSPLKSKTSMAISHSQLDMRSEHEKEKDADKAEIKKYGVISLSLLIIIYSVNGSGSNTSMMPRRNSG